MPMKSQAQRRFLWAKDPDMARRWEKHTSQKNLPEKIGGKKKRKAKKSKKASSGRRKNVQARSKRR